MSLTTTLAPRRASSSANSRPRPRPAPVAAAPWPERLASLMNLPPSACYACGQGGQAAPAVPSVLLAVPGECQTRKPQQQFPGRRDQLAAREFGAEAVVDAEPERQVAPGVLTVDVKTLGLGEDGRVMVRRAVHDDEVVSGGQLDAGHVGIRADYPVLGLQRAVKTQGLFHRVGH